MHPIKLATEKLIPYPIEVQQNAAVERKSKIAFIVLIIFFVPLGGLVISGGLTSETNRMAYILFGFVLCVFPFILHLFLKRIREHLVVRLDKDGIKTSSGKVYCWESLNSITFNISKNKYSDEKLCYMLDFNFKDSYARASHTTNKFSHIILIAEQLPVKKIRKENSEHL